MSKSTTTQPFKDVQPDIVDRLVTAIQELSLAGDLDTIKEIVSRTARDLSGADGATIVMREDGLCHYIDENAIGPLWKGRRFPMDSCISGWVMQSREAAAVEDIYADSRIPEEAYQPTFVKSVVMVPIRQVDPIGAIGTYWAHHHKASDTEVRCLQALADATAVAIERAQVYRELERRVQERTSELEAANRRLAIETKERRETERPLANNTVRARRRHVDRTHLASIVASGIAHELNQPLSAVNTYIGSALDLLRRDPTVSGQTIDALESAAAENWRTVETVRKFRDMLRRREPDFQPTDLNAQIRSAAAFIEDELREFGVALGLDLDDDLQVVWCDRNQVDHVLLNIMRNGVDAMRDADITHGSLHVRTRPGREGFVQVTVSDDGPGLDEPEFKNLFTPYNTSKDTGLGLGLSVSRSIVEAHGGDLWADRGCDRGAAFHFTLPMYRGAD